MCGAIFNVSKRSTHRLSAFDLSVVERKFAVTAASSENPHHDSEKSSEMDNSA
jgi:hypothetical protein